MLNTIFIAAVLAQSGQLNDTGMTTCLMSDGKTPTEVCAGTGQDAEFGRDAEFPRGSDGKAGFRFQKISATGAALPANATSWACVKDLTTGLLWELKTDDGGPRDASNIYTNFGDGRPGDSSEFVEQVNAASLCGSASWRLPAREELLGLIDYSRATGAAPIDENAFPNTADDFYWSSSPFAGGTSSSWAMAFERRIRLHFGKNVQAHAVRLVHGTARPAPSYSFIGDEVHDLVTGLIWKRCVEGMRWNGATCVGGPTLMTWAEALSYANRAGAPWRLPNPKELISIQDPTRCAPPIDPMVFPNTPVQRYWSSTHDTGKEDGAMFVNFEHGGTTNHANRRSYPIRLVRFQ